MSTADRGLQKLSTKFSFNVVLATRLLLSEAVCYILHRQGLEIFLRTSSWLTTSRATAVSNRVLMVMPWCYTEFQLIISNLRFSRPMLNGDLAEARNALRTRWDNEVIDSFPDSDNQSPVVCFDPSLLSLFSAYHISHWHPHIPSNQDFSPTPALRLPAAILLASKLSVEDPFHYHGVISVPSKSGPRASC